MEWAEVDARLTRDGQHILSHDSTVKGISDAAWPVSEHTLEELLRLDVGSSFANRYAGERLLSFKDCLRLAKGRLNLYLDCKAVDPEQLAREIVAAGMERQVVVFANLGQLRRVHAAAAGRIALMAKWHPAFALPAWVETNHLDAVEIDADESRRPSAAPSLPWVSRSRPKASASGTGRTFGTRSSLRVPTGSRQTCRRRCWRMRFGNG